MTEQTKEQVWKEEARKAYQDQQTQDNEGGCREPIGFVQGYLAAKKSDFKEIELLMVRVEDAQKRKDDLETERETMLKDNYFLINQVGKRVQEVKTLKEQLAEAVKLAKLGIYSVDGLLTHNHESWELSAESWLFKTKIFLEKQNKENKE